jgi:hypothetical protein
MHKDRRVLSHLVPTDAEYGMFLYGRSVFVRTVAQPRAFRRLRVSRALKIRVRHADEAAAGGALREPLNNSSVADVGAA